MLYAILSSCYGGRERLVFLKQAMSLRYGEATRSLIAANFAGIKHPHYIYSYYIIAKEF